MFDDNMWPPARFPSPLIDEKKLGASGSVSLTGDTLCCDGGLASSLKKAPPLQIIAKVCVFLRQRATPARKFLSLSPLAFWPTASRFL